MIVLISLLFGLHHVHESTGPNGWVMWIQPPHLSAGIAMIRHHLTWWLQWRA